MKPYAIFLLLIIVAKTNGNYILMPDESVTMIFDTVSAVVVFASQLLNIVAIVIQEVKGGILHFLRPPTITFGNGTIIIRSRDWRETTSSDSVGSITLKPVNNGTDLDTRIQNVLQNIRAQVPKAVTGIENDIRIYNQNTAVLFLGNFFGGVYGILTATSADIYTLGHVIQALAQALYGYGYSTPFGFEFQVPKLACGPRDLEGALAQYSFLNNPSPALDKRLLTYYCLLLNQEIIRRLFCLRINTSSNSDVATLKTQINLYTSLLQMKFS